MAVVYKKSKLSDSKYAPLIKKIAEDDGKSVEEVTKELKEEIKKRMSFLKTDGVETMRDNVVEEVIFDRVKPSKVRSERIFNVATFETLVDSMINSNPNFVPLRNAWQRKGIRPVFMVYPGNSWDMAVDNGKVRDGLPPTGDAPDTAWCDKNAWMAFNSDFAERLLQFAKLSELKPSKGVKFDHYVSNGGDIPDEWGYVEMVMVHELMHYARADHFYSEHYKSFKKLIPNAQKRNRVLNWAGDFINNHTIVDMGYPQLPMGLFSKDINYDAKNSDGRHLTYKELVEKTLGLYNELYDANGEDAVNDMNKRMDDHINSDDKKQEGGEQGQGEQGQGEQGQQGQGEQGQGEQGQGEQGQDQQGQQGQGQQGQDQQGQQGQGEQGQQGQGQQGQQGQGEQGQQGQGEQGQQGQEGSNGSPSNEELEKDGNRRDSDDAPPSGGTIPDFDMSDEELDKLMREQENGIQNAIKKDADISTSPEAREKREADNRAKAEQHATDIKNSRGTGVKYENPSKPTMTWEQIIKKMSSSVKKSEETYAKLASTAGTMTSAIGVTGSGALPPGMKKFDDSSVKKIVFVIDNSGSVYQQIQNANLQILKILKKGGLSEAYFMPFSSNFKLWKVNVKKKPATGDNFVDSYLKTLTLTSKFKPNSKAFVVKNRPMKTVLGEADNLGTTLSKDLVDILKILHRRKFDIVLFSDADLTWGSNVDAVGDLLTLGRRRPKSVSVIMADLRSYKKFIDTFGWAPNITSF